MKNYLDFSILHATLTVNSQIIISIIISKT
jgi:hypothetical protein